MSRNHNNKDKNKKNITNKKLDCSNNRISPLIINKKQNNRKLFLLDISNNKKQDNLLLFTTNKYNKQTDLNKEYV